MARAPDGADVEIRAGTPADRDRVLELWACAHPSSSVTDTAPSLSDLLALDPDALLLAEVDGELAGALIAAWNGWRGSFFRLAVRPERRRQGLATLLVREGERRLRARGALRVDAIVSSADRAVQAFWRALGYQLQGERARFVRNFSSAPAAPGAAAAGAAAAASVLARGESQPQAPAGVRVGALRASDWPQVKRIYEAGIASGDATFEAAAPSSWREWARARPARTRLAARDGAGRLLGWAALSPTSTRAVYRGVAEVGIYVDPGHARRGVGGALLRALIEASERAGIWTLQAGIFPENQASIALHERCGFELVGVRRRIGQMPGGRWRDVHLYERRSASAGAG